MQGDTEPLFVRLNYISPDRPDIGYAVKESAQNMSKPRASDFQKLREIGRYLVGKPRRIMRFDGKRFPTELSPSPIAIGLAAHDQRK